MDTIQTQADRHGIRKLRLFTFQNFQFHFHNQVISEIVLTKTQKLQLWYCPDGLLVKLCVSEVEGPSSNPACAIFLLYFFFL